MSDTPSTPIVDEHGKPLRRAADEDCPHCGAGPDKRRPSSGFGTPSTLCGKCGHDFHEVWRG